MSRVHVLTPFGFLAFLLSSERQAPPLTMPPSGIATNCCAGCCCPQARRCRRALRVDEPLPPPLVAASGMDTGLDISAVDAAADVVAAVVAAADAVDRWTAATAAAAAVGAVGATAVSLVVVVCSVF